MIRLPPTLKTCHVPRALSPSQMAFGDRCLLRAVLGSSRSAAALAAHPAAALGRVFHRFLEQAVRRDQEGSSDDSGVDANTLDRLLDEEDRKLASTWGSSAPRLREIFPPLVWRRKRRSVLDLAAKYQSEAIPRARPSVGGGFLDAKLLPRDGKWAEVPLDVPELRLQGRADLLERVNGDVTIRDLKTGRVRTDDGELSPHITKQVRLYGLMARAIWPSATISLAIDDGVDHEVSFDRVNADEISAWLAATLARLPAEHDVDAESLASPGEACETCAHRHVCSAYLKVAPGFWSGEAPVRFPLDVWGELVTVVPRGDNLADVTVRDAAGRAVKVFGLMGSRLDAAKSGDVIWFFGLRTRDRRGGEGAWRHPLNFFEVADDDPFARAWTLETFVVST